MHLETLLSQHPARNGIMDVMDILGPEAQDDVETQEELVRDQSDPWSVLFQYQVGDEVHDTSKSSKSKHHQLSVSAVSLINVVSEHYEATVDHVVLEEYLVQEETSSVSSAKKRAVHPHAGDVELSIDGEPTGIGKSLTCALMALAASIIRAHNPKTAYGLRQPWSLSCWETFVWPGRCLALREFKKALVSARLRLKELAVVSSLQVDSYAALSTELTPFPGDIDAQTPTSGNDIDNNAEAIADAGIDLDTQPIANADTDPEMSPTSDLDINREKTPITDANHDPNSPLSIDADIDTKTPAVADEGLDLSKEKLMGRLGEKLVRARLHMQKYFSLLVERSSNLHETASKATSALLRADACRYIREHLGDRDRCELHPVIRTCFEAFETLDGEIQTFYNNIHSEVPLPSTLGGDWDRVISNKASASIPQTRPLAQRCAELLDCLTSPQYQEHELYQFQLWQMTQRPNTFFNLPDSLPGRSRAKEVSEMTAATAPHASAFSRKYPVVAVGQRNVVLRMARNLILAKRKLRAIEAKEGSTRGSRNRKKWSKNGAHSKRMIEDAFARSFSPTHPNVRHLRTQHLDAFLHFLAALTEGSATAWSPPRDNEGTFSCVREQLNPEHKRNHKSDGRNKGESADKLSSQYGTTLLPWYYSDSICTLMQLCIDTRLYIGSYENGLVVELDEKTKRRNRLSDAMMRDQLLPVPHSLERLTKLLRLGIVDDEDIASNQPDLQTLNSHLDGPLIDKNDASLYAQLLALKVGWVQTFVESRWPSAQFLSRCHFAVRADLRHLVRYTRGILGTLRSEHTWQLFNLTSVPFAAVSHNRSVSAMLQDEGMWRLWQQALAVMQLFFRISTLCNESITSAFLPVATMGAPQDRKMAGIIAMHVKDLRQLSITSLGDFSKGNNESVLEHLTSLYISVHSGRLQAKILRVIQRFLDQPGTQELRFGSTEIVRRHYRALVNRLIDDHGSFGASMMPSTFDSVNGGLAVLAATELLRNIAAKSLKYFTKLTQNAGEGNESLIEWEGKWNELARVIFARMQEMLSLHTTVRSFTQLVSAR